MTQTINLPSWFKYNLNDFTGKNKEVWTYIEKINDFNKVMELLCCFAGVEEQIESGVSSIIDENFYKYKNIEQYFNKNIVNIFIKNFNEFYIGYKDRYLLKDIIDQDLKEINKIKNEYKIFKNKIKKFEKFSKYIGQMDRNSGGVEYTINLALKCGNSWKKFYMIADTPKASLESHSANFVIELFPKTFKYAKEKKLHWHLCGWVGNTF